MENYESSYTGEEIDSAVGKVKDNSDTWTSKQEALVSGTNIKTINNNSILGSGNLTLDGGKVDDVKVNGISVVTNKVANVSVLDSASINDSGLISFKSQGVSKFTLQLPIYSDLS